jgi:hypothetical protein
MNMDEFFAVQLIMSNSLPPRYGLFQTHYKTSKDKWHVNELVCILVQEESKKQCLSNKDIIQFIL